MINDTAVEKELLPYAVQADELNTLPVAELTLDETNDLLGRVQQSLHELASKKESVARPLLDAKRALDELFRGPVRAFEAFKASLKEHATRLLAAQREAQRAALAAGDVQTAVTLTPTRGTTRKERKITIVDPSLVPTEYWILDVDRITREALAGAEIPGVAVDVVEVAQARKVRE